MINEEACRFILNELGKSLYKMDDLSRTIDGLVQSMEMHWRGPEYDRAQTCYEEHMKKRLVLDIPQWTVEMRKFVEAILSKLV